MFTCICIHMHMYAHSQTHRHTHYQSTDTLIIRPDTLIIRPLSDLIIRAQTHSLSDLRPLAARGLSRVVCLLSCALSFSLASSLSYSLSVPHTYYLACSLSFSLLSLSVSHTYYWRRRKRSPQNSVRDLGKISQKSALTLFYIVYLVASWLLRNLPGRLLAILITASSSCHVTCHTYGWVMWHV